MSKTIIESFVGEDGKRRERMVTTNGEVSIEQKIVPQTTGNEGEQIQVNTSVGGQKAYRTTLHPDSPPHYHDETETHPRNR
jgi:hypothetical protein